MIALKKATSTYSPEELKFANEKYSAQKHDEMIAVNVYVFLVGAGCVEVVPSTGSLSVNHNLVLISDIV